MAYRIHYSDYVALVPTPPPPSGESVPGGPSFIGNPQPPDVPCDPTGDGWRGPPGPQGGQGDQGIPGPPGTVGNVPEAPTDGAVYGRQGSTASWSAALPLIGGTIGGPLYWTATGSSATRSAQDRSGEWRNVRDYGAKLDGTTNDTAAYVAARNAAGASSGSGGGGTVYVPAGRQGTVIAPTYSAPPVLWKMDGVTFPAGTTPVTSITIGDMVENFFNGTKFFGRSEPAGVATPTPVFRIDYSGKGTSNGAVALNQTSTDASGYMWGISNQQFVSGVGSGQTVGIASSVWKTGGRSPNFAFYASMADYTGTSVVGNASIGMEMDLFHSGPETAVNNISQASVGSRVTMHMVARSYIPPNWVANHTYALNTVVQSNPTNGFTYVCTTPGTSGATPPAWPTSAGTVADGTVVWTYGTTIVSQISRSLDIGCLAGQGYGTPGQASIGAAICTSNNVAIYNACVDFSDCTLDTVTNPNAAGIRLKANMPIDFSGDTTTAGQNVHTLVYRSATQRLYYVVAGVDKWSIDASGNMRCAGTVTPSVTP